MARGRRRSRATIVALSVVVVLAFAPATANAATVAAAWQAKLGSAGVNGSATILAYSSAMGSIALKLAKFRAATYLPVVLSKGTCSSLGSTLLRFSAIQTTSSGAAARTTSLTTSQVTLIKSATKGTSTIALRVGSSTTGGVKCGVFAANPFPSPTLATVGPAEVVFNWSTDRCEDLDIPDLPARAFRDAQGNVQLLAAHYINRRFIGPSLDTVKHDCTVIMASAGDPNPAAFSYHQWIASPYTTDGQTIYALVHDEYYGSYPDGGSCQFTCWYNAITLAVSTDGGASYHPAATPPGNLVASSPHQYEETAGPYGFNNPSNIIKGLDGYYYAYLHEFLYGGRDWAICLMRTPDVSDPSSWRAWDGTGFTVAFVDPYLHPAAAGSARACAGITDLGLMNESVTFNTYLHRYVMVGITADHIGGREVWGIYYAFSNDLIHWPHYQLLAEVPLGFTAQPGDAHHYGYPSLIDPSSPSRNFDTAGQHAYIYLTRFNRLSGNYLDRDLIRVPVEFFPTTLAASQARVPFTP